MINHVWVLLVGDLERLCMSILSDRVVKSQETAVGTEIPKPGRILANETVYS